MWHVKKCDFQKIIQTIKKWCEKNVFYKFCYFVLRFVQFLLHTHLFCNILIFFSALVVGRRQAMTVTVMQEVTFQNEFLNKKNKQTVKVVENEIKT